MWYSLHNTNNIWTIALQVIGIYLTKSVDYYRPVFQCISDNGHKQQTLWHLIYECNLICNGQSKGLINYSTQRSVALLTLFLSVFFCFFFHAFLLCWFLQLIKTLMIPMDLDKSRNPYHLRSFCLLVIKCQAIKNPCFFWIFDIRYDPTFIRCGHFRKSNGFQFALSNGWMILMKILATINKIKY